MAVTQPPAQAPVSQPAPPSPDQGGAGGPLWRHAEIGFGAVLMVAAVGAYRTAADYPGLSGSYPRTLSVLLGIGAALVILRAALRPGAMAGVTFFIHPPRAALGFAALAAYVTAISYIGYLIPSVILGVTLPMVLGYRKPGLVGSVTLGTILFIVLVFFVILERPLPPDLLQPLLEMLR